MSKCDANTFSGDRMTWYVVWVDTVCQDVCFLNAWPLVWTIGQLICKQWGPGWCVNKLWRFIWVPNVCQYLCFQKKNETCFGILVSGIYVCTTDLSNCKQWGPGWRVTERGVSSGSTLLVRTFIFKLLSSPFSWFWYSVPWSVQSNIPITICGDLDVLL